MSETTAMFSGNGGAVEMAVAKAAAQLAAQAHLRAIEWAPEQGLSDADLGIGEEAWGGSEAWQSGRGWTALCEDAVRRLAAEMAQRFSEAEEAYRERGAAEARAAIEDGATAPWGDGVFFGSEDASREARREWPAAMAEVLMAAFSKGFKQTFAAEAPRAEVES